MVNTRAVFRKYDRAKFISHLDLYRCMQRAFKRSSLPVWYTEGFNPHLYLMFPLPLSLGYESDCEIIDFSLTEELDNEYVKNKLNSALPEGIKIEKVFTPIKKHIGIAFSEFSISLFYQKDYYEEFTKFISQEKILTLKRNKKKKYVEIDLKPIINCYNIKSENNILSFDIKLPSGTQQNFNPSLLLTEFEKYIDVEADYVYVKRNKIICIDGEEFL